MILTSATSGTKRATPENIATLKACDRVETFSESGWCIASGFQDGRLVIAVHFDNWGQYRAVMKE